MNYDAEANIISWEIAKGDISHARVFGQLIIHFSPKGKPVLVEILNASKFKGQFEKIKTFEKLKKVMPVS